MNDTQMCAVGRSFMRTGPGLGRADWDVECPRPAATYLPLTWGLEDLALCWEHGGPGMDFLFDQYVERGLIVG